MAIIALLVILVLLNVIMAIAAIIWKQDLTICETNESPYCPQYICQYDTDENLPGVTGIPARRIDSDGNVQYSTTTGELIQPAITSDGNAPEI